ncbi:helix-turn-helix domain-containing protein [Pseudalkalibacillus sp. A8]|uniref:helix-turn-helix domain-containing protein n=1 Tax=Pseudalkalibacillus sp. A8 TaxID=3382641 RepID=UPI0038B68609
MKRINLEFIKSERIKHNIPLKEMAIELGFKNASTYLKYENGTYSFKADHLPLLATKLGCDINSLFFNHSVSKTEIFFKNLNKTITA